MKPQQKCWGFFMSTDFRARDPEKFVWQVHHGKTGRSCCVADARTYWEESTVTGTEKLF